MPKDYAILRRIYRGMTSEQVCKSVIDGFSVDNEPLGVFGQRDQSGNFSLDRVVFNLSPSELALMTI